MASEKQVILAVRAISKRLKLYYNLPYFECLAMENPSHMTHPVNWGFMAQLDLFRFEGLSLDDALGTDAHPGKLTEKFKRQLKASLSGLLGPAFNPAHDRAQDQVNSWTSRFIQAARDAAIIVQHQLQAQAAKLEKDEVKARRASTRVDEYLDQYRIKSEVSRKEIVAKAKEFIKMPPRGSHTVDIAEHKRFVSAFIPKGNRLAEEEEAESSTTSDGVEAAIEEQNDEISTRRAEASPARQSQAAPPKPPAKVAPKADDSSEDEDRADAAEGHSPKGKDGTRHFQFDALPKKGPSKGKSAKVGQKRQRSSSPLRRKKR